MSNYPFIDSGFSWGPYRLIGRDDNRYETMLVGEYGFMYAWNRDTLVVVFSRPDESGNYKSSELKKLVPFKEIDKYAGRIRVTKGSRKEQIETQILIAERMRL